MWSAASVNSRAFDYYSPLRKLRDHFQQNYSESISLSEAAAIVGLEKKHFGKFFRSRVGIGFKEWTELIRLERAMEIMRARDHSMVEVAFAIGFHNVRTFERVFKKHTHITPREFKKTVAPCADARTA
jgi:transcriptional regulator GlxA family with amidase domain